MFPIWFQGQRHLWITSVWKCLGQRRFMTRVQHMYVHFFSDMPQLPYQWDRYHLVTYHWLSTAHVMQIWSFVPATCKLGHCTCKNKWCWTSLMMTRTLYRPFHCLIYLSVDAFFWSQVGEEGSAARVLLHITERTHGSCTPPSAQCTTCPMPRVLRNHDFFTVIFMIWDTLQVCTLLHWGVAHTQPVPGQCALYRDATFWNTLGGLSRK